MIRRKRWHDVRFGINEDYNANGLDRQLRMSNRYMTGREWERFGEDWLRRHNFETDKFSHRRSRVEVHTYYIDKYGQEREIKELGNEKFKFVRCYFNRNHDLVFLVATHAPKYDWEEI